MSCLRWPLPPETVQAPTTKNAEEFARTLQAVTPKTHKEKQALFRSCHVKTINIVEEVNVRINV